MVTVLAPEAVDTIGGIDQMSTRDLAEIVEFVGAFAYQDMIRAMPVEVASRFGASAERIGSAIAVAATRVDVPFLNRVIGAGLREPLTETVLDRIEGLYRGAAIRYMLQLSPALLSAELEARLTARGLERMDNWSQLIRGVELPPEISTDLRVATVGPAHAQDVAELICACFGMESEYAPFMSGLVGRTGWRHYVAFDGGTPVATGALYVRGLVGYLTFGATLESHRRRGAQGAIMARRIRDAADLGCRWLVTETPEETPEHPNPSYHNMLRTGFRLAYQRPNYVYTPA